MVVIFALCTSRSVRAQSYSTYTVNGIASSIDGPWYIGADGSFNSLTVNNAGWLSVNGDTTLGYQAGANHNSALVSDSGSVWDNQGDLVVGDAGSRNRLTVANGGMVNNYNGWIGGNGAQAGQSVLQLANTDSNLSLQQSITRLSTGLRINTSADDVAGLSLNATANNNAVRVTGAGGVDWGRYIYQGDFSPLTETKTGYASDGMIFTCIQPVNQCSPIGNAHLIFTQQG